MKIVILVCLIFLCAIESNAQELNYKNLQDSIIKAISSQDAEAVVPKTIPPTLQIVFNEEKPNEFQKKQITILVNTLAEKVKKQNFKSYPDFAFFISNKLGDSGKDTPLLKDAFPLEPNAEPLGSFDCDSKALIVLAVAEKMSMPLGRLYIVNQVNHVIMFDDKQYFDLNINQIVKLSEEALLKTDLLTTPQKIRSLLMFNVATNSAIESGVMNAFQRTNGDMKNQAIEKLKAAVDLNSKNIAALHNLYVLTKNPDYNIGIAGIMISNYTDIRSKDAFNIPINIEVPVKRDIPDDKQKLTDAIKGSNSIRNIIWDTMSEYGKEQLEKTILLGELLLSSGDKDEDAFINAYLASAYYAKGEKNIARKHYNTAYGKRHSADYPKEAAEYFDDIFGDLFEIDFIADVIDGTIILTKDNIKEYAEKHPVINLIYSGEGVSLQYVIPLERLRAWSGCKDLLNSLKGIVKRTAEDFCN